APGNPDFLALAPAAARVVERERARSGRAVERRWALRLARRLPWPAFQSCDLSASFAPLSAQFALLTPAHAVRELSFEGDSLWAYFEG
ncbi:MAG TPA: hypothetical protein VH309_03455, partial [Elusimicrobiota bacterium]|nr:hypothetical protein [Elusimicrobiota bacterium]